MAETSGGGAVTIPQPLEVKLLSSGEKQFIADTAQKLFSNVNFEMDGRSPTKIANDAINRAIVLAALAKGAGILE